MVISELASFLVKSGNSLFVISNCKKPPNNIGYHVYRTPRFYKTVISTVAHLIVTPALLVYIHLRKKIEIIQVAGLIDFIAALPAKLIFHIPIVIRLSSHRHPRLVKQFRAVVCAADVIITLSNDMQTKIINEGFSEKKVSLIPNGVNTEKFKSVRTETQTDSKINVLWIGSLDMHKQPHLAIKAFSILKAQYGNMHLEVVGEGKLKRQLEKMILSNNLKDTVVFLGFQSHDKVAELMSKADIFLMTSRGEGMSNVLLEAMASGMAIVSTSASASGIIENGVNGFIADNIEEMCSAISKLASDTSLRNTLGQKARKTVLEKYSQYRMLRDYLELYKKIERKKSYAR